MAAGVTLVSNLTVGQAVPTEFIAEIAVRQQQGRVVRNVVFQDILPSGEGNTYDISEMVRLSAFALVEGVDMAQAQQLSTTELLSLNPSEIGCQVVLSDKSASKFTKKGGSLPRMVGALLGNAIITKEDVDGLGQASGYTLGLGSDSTTMTLGHMIAAVNAIHGGDTTADSTAIAAGTMEPPSGQPISIIVNSRMAHPVHKELSGGTQVPNTDETTLVAQYGASMAAALRTSVDRAISPVAGATVFIDENLAKNASNGVVGMAFSKMSLAYIGFDGGVHIERERDSSLRGTEYNTWVYYAWGERKDIWGRKFTFDGSLPTS